MKSTRGERGREERRGAGRQWRESEGAGRPLGGGISCCSAVVVVEAARRRPMWSPSSRSIMSSPLGRLADNFRGRKVPLVGHMENRHISYFLRRIMFENRLNLALYLCN